MAGKISKNRLNHPLVDTSIVENVKFPPAFAYPFALVFTDGSLQIFWAESKQELAKWRELFTTLVTAPSNEPGFVNYVIKTKTNLFLTTLYMSLERINPEEQLQSLTQTNEMI